MIKNRGYNALNFNRFLQILQYIRIKITLFHTRHVTKLILYGRLKSGAEIQFNIIGIGKSERF